MALEEGLNKIVIVVTPLNLLGKQTEKQLNEAGLSCVAINKENSNPATFKVCPHLNFP
jgi:ATP-dependent DNA helicase RecQ